MSNTTPITKHEENKGRSIAIIQATLIRDLEFYLQMDDGPEKDIKRTYIKQGFRDLKHALYDQATANINTSLAHEEIDTMASIGSLNSNHPPFRLERRR